MSNIANENTPSQNSHNIHIVLLTLLWVFIPPIYGVVVWFKDLSFGQKILRIFSVVFSPMTYVFLGLLIVFIEKRESQSHYDSSSETTDESDSAVHIIPDYIQTKDEQLSPDLLTSFFKDLNEYDGCEYAFLCADSDTANDVFTYKEEGEESTLYLQTFTGGLLTIQQSFDWILRNDFALDLTIEETLTLSDLFTIWFGNPLFVSPEKGDLFKKVDVDALKKWKAFLPQSSDSWNGQTYQVIYTTLFQDFARLFSIGYVSLQSENIETHVQEYIAVAEQDIGEEYSKALEYLQNKYNNRFSELHAPLKAQSESDEDHYGEIFQPYMSIGFWLRRHHDGSAKILWDMTHGILKEYDPEWIGELQTKYPNVKIWDTPIKMTTETSLFHAKKRAYVKVDYTAVFFELWIDGRYHQLNKVAAVTPGKHIVSSVNCIERYLASDEVNPSDEIPSCDCNTFDTTFFNEEIRILRYNHDKSTSCNPEEFPIK